MERAILHIDMNNCFASIEIKLNPELKNLPIAVSGSSSERHGIILAKSEEAKKFGVKTAETIWQAKRKCPELILVKPHYDEYKKHSLWARDIYYSYTNQVEPFGLDEAWLDITGSQKLFGTPMEIAEKIRKQIKNELGITVSIGLSYNKIFAKLGSDISAPDAITKISKDNFKDKVWPLEVDRMIGIGKSAKSKLNEHGIYTLGDIANSNREFLVSILGSSGEKAWYNANGLEDSEVLDFNFREPIKSIGHGTTLVKNLENEYEVHQVFQRLALKVGARLIENNMEAMGLQISVKDSDLVTFNYQEGFDFSTFSSIIIKEKAMKLFKNYKWEKPIRFLEIRAINLTKDTNVQINFIESEDFDRKVNLDKALYDLRTKYGGEKITFASQFEENKMKESMQDISSLPSSREENN